MPITLTNTRLTMLVEDAIRLMPKGTEIGVLANWALSACNANEQPLLRGARDSTYGQLVIYDLRGYLELPRELEHLAERLVVTYHRQSGGLCHNRKDARDLAYTVGRRWQQLVQQRFTLLLSRTPQAFAYLPDRMYTTLRDRSRNVVKLLTLTQEQDRASS